MDAVIFPYAIIQKTDAQDGATHGGASVAIKNALILLAIHGCLSAQNAAQIWLSEKEVMDRSGDAQITAATTGILADIQKMIFHHYRLQYKNLFLSVILALAQGNRQQTLWRKTCSHSGNLC